MQSINCNSETSSVSKLASETVASMASLESSYENEDMYVNHLLLTDFNYVLNSFSCMVRFGLLLSLLYF